MAHKPKSFLTLGNIITLVIGIVAGVVMPVIGLFIGLQVSPSLGTVLVAPYIGVATLFDTYVGSMSGFARLLGLALSIVAYVVLAFGVRHLIRLALRR